MDDFEKRLRELEQKAHQRPAPGQWELFWLTMEVRIMILSKKWDIVVLQWVIFASRVENFVLELGNKLLAWYLGEDSPKR